MDKDEVAAKIMNYLRKHPAAGDTLEGITKWWLQSEKIEESVENVAMVIEELMKNGLIARQVRGEKAYYKVGEMM